MKHNLRQQGCSVDSRKLKMCVGPFVLDVVYSATYSPSDCGYLADDFDLSVESIYATGEGCDPDEDCGPWLSQQALNTIEEKCEEDFNDNMASIRQSQYDEWMADQAEARRLYRECE